MIILFVGLSMLATFCLNLVGLIDFVISQSLKVMIFLTSVLKVCDFFLVTTFVQTDVAIVMPLFYRRQYLVKRNTHYLQCQAVLSCRLPKYHTDVYLARLHCVCVFEQQTLRLWQCFHWISHSLNFSLPICAHACTYVRVNLYTWNWFCQYVLWNNGTFKFP